MRVAMENPDLGITLPDGYGALTPQVQYMIELGVLAQSVWEQKELVTLKNKIDALAQKLANLPASFNDQQSEEYRSIGQEYLKRTNEVDKTYERLEGNYQGDIVEPMVVLGLLTTPYQSIDKATKVDRMDQWLDSAMNDYITGEAFFNKYKFDPPNVKGNDINNTLTGLDDTMEISFDNKLHWLDLANIQKLDLSGNKTAAP
ncbi:hypothetical protein HK101_007786 [Irineochytrium annulatum]|nr:hypothetical protein HK101_007786 [Irineochytrium annulatum]